MFNTRNLLNTLWNSCDGDARAYAFLLEQAGLTPDEIKAEFEEQLPDRIGEIGDFIPQAEPSEVQEPKKFYVAFAIDARYVACVSARDMDEAKRLATREFENADFGEAECVDGEICSIEGDNGNYLWER